MLHAWDKGTRCCNMSCITEEKFRKTATNKLLMLHLDWIVISIFFFFLCLKTEINGVWVCSSLKHRPVKRRLCTLAFRVLRTSFKSRSCCEPCPWLFIVLQRQHEGKVVRLMKTTCEIWRGYLLFLYKNPRLGGFYDHQRTPSCLHCCHFLK